MNTAKVKGKLAERAEEVCGYLLPGGKRHGSEWVAGSIAGEAGKSLKVSLNGGKAGVWQDFASGPEDKGDLLDLWRRVRGVDFRTALDQARQWLGLPDDGDRPAYLARPHRTFVRPSLDVVVPLESGGPVYDYLTKERGLLPDVLQRYRVGQMLHASKGPVIAFPCCEPFGEAVDLLKFLAVARPDGKKECWSSTDSKDRLFGWQAISGDCRRVVITEGEIDALTVAGWGFPALSVPRGTNALDWIEHDFDALQQFERIDLCTDMDAAGQKAADAIAEHLGRDRCFRVVLPPDFKDANDAHQNGEFAAVDFRACLDGARESIDAGLRARLDAARLNPDIEPPALMIRFTLNGVPIATPGNLVSICAAAKAGKSAFIGACIGTTFTDHGDGDFLGVRGFNADGKAVVHVDTEQAQFDHWALVRIAMRRAGLKSAPPWLHSYGTAGWTAAERRGALAAMLRIAGAQYGGIHAVLIDGIADFVNDPNAGDECFPFVDELRGLSVQYACPIFTVLHLNPGTEKSRGHLGSQLERRAETNLILEKDGDSGRTVVYATKQRRAPILKADGPCFRWDDAEQMHVSVESIRGERDSKVAERARELAGEIFSGRGGLAHSAAISALKTTLKCSDATAERRFNEMRDHKAIVRFPPNLWAIAS